MTADADRCAVTELPKDGCDHCRPAPARPDPAADGEYGSPVTAAYGGACAEECGDRIHAGDVIRAHPDGGWVHDGCAP